MTNLEENTEGASATGEGIAETRTAKLLAGQAITLGRIVHYTLSVEDANAINQRRGADTFAESWPKGAQAHVGNYAYAGGVFPMLVTKVWNDAGTVNGQVFLDGNDALWVTSAHEGGPGTPGTWHWPPRV